MMQAEVGTAASRRGKITVQEMTRGTSWPGELLFPVETVDVDPVNSVNNFWHLYRSE
jgi:hypothetical protein